MQTPALCTRISAFSSAGTVKCSFFLQQCSAGFRGPQAGRGFHKLRMPWGILGLLSIGPLWGFAHPLIPPRLLRRQESLCDHRGISDAVSSSHYFSCACSLFLVQLGSPESKGTRKVQCQGQLRVFPECRCHSSRWLRRQERDEAAKTILSSSFTSAIVESFLRRI